MSMILHLTRRWFSSSPSIFRTRLKNITGSSFHPGHSSIKQSHRLHTTMSKSRKKIILDCDTGGDDAQAILLALAQPDVDLLAITAVFGNNSAENTAKNTLRILKFKGRSDIPVFRGCGRSLIGDFRPSAFFGKDGLGDITIEGVDPVTLSEIQSEHAALALVRIINEHPGEITLVATGPLTNIAVALQLDPLLGTKLRDIFVMGGTSEAKGNVTPCGEFNFVCDPEAAVFVLNHIGRKVTLATKEICEAHAFSWEWYEKFTSTGSKTSDLISRFEKGVVNIVKQDRGAGKYILIWDQFTIAAAINDDVITKACDVYVTVELHGTHTRGQSVIDWNNKLQRQPNVRLMQEFDQELLDKMMQSHVKE